MHPANGHGHGHSSPNDLARIGTNGTAGSVSSRSEKRRSGFFGLGGKKDKDKEKLHEEKQAQGVSASADSDLPQAPRSFAPG